MIHNREEAHEVTEDFSYRIEGLAELRRAMESRRSAARDTAAQSCIRTPAIELRERPAEGAGRAGGRRETPRSGCV